MSAEAGDLDAHRDQTGQPALSGAARPGALTAGGRTPSDVPGLDIAEMRSWQNFLEAAHRLTSRINRELTGAHELSLEDVRMLQQLAAAESGTVRMGTLAQTLQSTPSRVSRQMDAMAGRGLACRVSSPKDGRHVLASITDRGREVLAQAQATYSRGVRTHYLDRLSRSQTVAMSDNCRRILDALKCETATRRRGRPAHHSTAAPDLR